jgi:hypothetical protein
MKRRGILRFSSGFRAVSRYLIALALLCLFSLPPLWAGGQPEEDPIRTAEALVEEGRINEAILLLEEVVREDPRRLEQAEDLMNRILSIRSDYNDLFAQLIDHLESNPGEIETTLDIIARMEALDEYPNERVVAQITEARLIAQLAYDRNLAEQIVEDAARLIAEGRHAEAVERYLSGFDLQTEVYRLREYPVSFYASAAEARQAVESAAQAFLARAPDVRGVTDSMVSALSFSPETPIPSRNVLDQRLAALVGPWESVHSEEGRVTENGETLETLRQQVSEFYPEDPVDWHLTFLDTFATGRPGFEDEGINGAMSVMLEDSRDAVGVAARNGAEATDTLRLQAAEGRAWTEAIAQALANADRYEVAADAWLLEAEVPPGTEVAEAAPLLPPDPRADYAAHLLRGRGYRQIAEGYTRLAAIDSEMEELVETPEGYRELRDIAGNQRGEIVTVLQEWENSAASVAALPGLETAVAETRGFVDEELSLLLAEATEIEVASLDAAVRIEVEGYGENLTVSRAEFGEGQALLEGLPESVEQEDGTTVTVTYRYPDDAAEVLDTVQARLAATEAGLQQLLNDFSEEPEYVLGDERIIEDVAASQALLEDTTALLSRVTIRLGEAQEQVRLAAELRSDGNALVAQARNAVNRNAVLEARELWNDAREAYFDSLEIQQDAAFREEADEIIATLGVQIQEAENRIVVARVRELITQAESQYDSEQYLQARETLLEARETWARTNVTENPEIARLLGFVSAALTLADKRNLEETEPLYPVLSNYLNLAREDFNQARAVRVGATEDRVRTLLIARADENLDNVLAVRPQNWEARVLKLRLLQLQDAENFDDAFASRVQAALNQRNENPEEALTSLETLREINPNYPGLQEAIVELEIRLGIRENPVTQQQIARSNQLLAEARSLTGGGEGGAVAIARTQQAIELLEQAVTVNPENRDAQLLLDRLRINTGGQASVALSSTDEQRFRRAETLFIQGNLGQALAIVQSLLQNPNNQQYPPLLDLRDRITSRLGI